MKDHERIVYVISNTHWDREWVKPFQESRINLIDFFEKLFQVLGSDPKFNFFHLDSQTIPLEDYLEILPGNRQLLMKYISCGRLLVGPWYTLPEMNVIDGECIVRNLLRGNALASSFGKVMKVGYTPTSTGQVSQLPQIYRGFGIDNIIFYRGTNQETSPAEYYWEGPDGTAIIGIRPPQHFSRCNFWGHIYLPVIHNYLDHIESSKVTAWSQGGGLMRMAEKDKSEYIELSPVKHFNINELNPGADRLLKSILPFATTPYLLTMDGHDQSFPHEETTRIIYELNNLNNGITWVHASLEAYVGHIREHMQNRDDNFRVKGEMRHTNRSQARNSGHLYPAVISTKYRLKQVNRNIENLLLRKVEPSAIMSYLCDADYNANALSLLWKWLLTNHSHDAINGCSADKVFHDMLYRFSETQVLGEGFLKRHLSSIISRIDTSGFSASAVLLTAFNFLVKPKSSINQVTFDVPVDYKGSNFSLVVPNGVDYPVQVISSAFINSSVNKIGFTKQMPVRRVQARIDTGDIPGMGYKTMEVKVMNTETANGGVLFDGKNTLENLFIKVVIQGDGTITLTDKKNQVIYPGLHFFTDQGETGNAWESSMPEKNEEYDSRHGHVSIIPIENGPLYASVKIIIAMELPECCVNDFHERSDKIKTLLIETIVSIDKYSEYPEFETTVDNRIRDHRLRVHFPLGSAVTSYYAKMPFDVVERPAVKESQMGWTEKPDPNDPNQGFIAASTGKGCLAVFNHALFESGISDPAKGTISLTLLRCFYQYGNWSVSRWRDEEFQNPGKHVFHYALYPFSEGWEEAKVCDRFEEYISKGVTVQHSPMDGDLPPQYGWFGLRGNGVHLSCLKPAENGKGVIVRLYNPGQHGREIQLLSAKEIKGAWLTNLNEEALQPLETDGYLINLNISHHKIVTILINY